MHVLCNTGEKLNRAQVGRGALYVDGTRGSPHHYLGAQAKAFVDQYAGGASEIDYTAFVSKIFA